MEKLKLTSLSLLCPSFPKSGSVIPCWEFEISSGGKVYTTEISKYYKSGLYILKSLLLNICQNSIGYISMCMYMYMYTHYQSLRIGYFKTSHWDYVYFYLFLDALSRFVLYILKPNHSNLRIVASYCWTEYFITMNCPCLPVVKYFAL